MDRTILATEWICYYEGPQLVQSAPISIDTKLTATGVAMSSVSLGAFSSLTLTAFSMLGVCLQTGPSSLAPCLRSHFGQADAGFSSM